MGSPSHKKNALDTKSTGRPSPAQLNYATGLTAKLCASWSKLAMSGDPANDKYKGWSEQKAHDILYEKHVTKDRKNADDDFTDYSKREITRAIAVLICLEASYHGIWTEWWTGNRDRQTAEREQDKEIVASCMTYEQAAEYLQANGKPYRVVEYYEFVKVIDNVSYWQRRKQTIKLYSMQEANTLYKSYRYDEHGYDFDSVFTLADVQGTNEILYTKIL